MPALSVDTLKVQLNFTIGGKDTTAGFWATCDAPSPPSNADASTLANDLAGTLKSGPMSFWKAFNDPGTIFTTVTVDYIPSGSTAIAAQGSGGGSGATIGTNAATSAASQSIVVSERSATVGRHGRGRMYLPATGGIPGGLTGYGFDPSDVGDLVGAFGTWFTTDFNSHLSLPFGTLTAVVRSLSTGLAHPITSVAIDTRPDRQERREDGQGFSTITANVT